MASERNVFGSLSLFLVSAVSVTIAEREVRLTAASSRADRQMISTENACV